MSKRRKARSTPVVVAWATLATAASIGLGVLIVGPTSANGDGLPSSLARLDTTRLAVQRESFCDRVPESAVTALLPENDATRASYSPGDTVTLSDGVKDLTDEYACEWGTATSPNNESIAAWVFAPPVTVADATSLIAGLPTGCNSIDAPAYGAPTQALQCTSGSDTSYWLRGLFGDAWLTCTTTGIDLGRTERFCAGVAKSASN